jgi:hypothetical protein
MLGSLCFGVLSYTFDIFINLHLNINLTMLFYSPIQFSNILYYRQLVLMIHFILLQTLSQVVFPMLIKEG